MTSLGGDQEVVPGPRIRELGRLLPGGIHGQVVDAGVALEMINAAIRGEQQGAADARHHQPCAAGLGEILKCRAHTGGLSNAYSGNFELPAKSMQVFAKC